jgi:hypothetical protein
MYISLLAHYIEQSTFFLSSAVLPHPTQSILFHIQKWLLCKGNTLCVSVTVCVSLPLMGNRALPSVRRDCPSCTSAAYSHSCIPTVRSFTQYNLISILQFFLHMRCFHTATVSYPTEGVAHGVSRDIPFTKMLR